VVDLTAIAWGSFLDQFQPGPRPAAADYPTPGTLAAHCEPRTVQTPALDLLDEALVDAADGTAPRLMWFMPPQEGKSQRVSRWFPLWLLLRNPELRIAICSYSDALARRWGRAVRNDILAHPSLGLTVRRDTSAANEWQLDGHDGGVITAGLESGLTGRPVDVLIIDDPVKGQAEADSETYREAAKEWWRGTASSRLAENAIVVLIMTRWHEDDLAGWLQTEDADSGRWRIVNIPAQADHKPDRGEQDPLGRDVGEYLTSARGRTVEGWLARRKDAGSRAWNALYQGRPAPQEGGILKRGWWQYYTRPRAVRRQDGTWHAIGADQVIQSWDMAFKDTTGSDFVVGQVWARRGPKAWLLDQVHDRLDFPATCDAVRQLTAKWPQAKLKLVEDKANGPAVVAQLRQTIGGFVTWDPKDSKEARAHAVSPFIEGGDVELPDASMAPWVAGFVDEAASFPNGTHDDQVDACTQALHRLLLDTGAGGRFMQQLQAERGARAS